MAKRMASTTEREAFAEEADRYVVVAAAASSRERDLVRPFPINRPFAQLSFAVDHSTTVKLVAARARRYLLGKGERSRSGGRR
jgi:hypothetical protein